MGSPNKYRAQDEHALDGVVDSEIMERGISETQSNGCWKAVHFIPMVEPVHFSAQPDPLPLDPYLLGLILGDGGVSARATVTITTMDDEMSIRQISVAAGPFTSRHGDQIESHQLQHSGGGKVSREETWWSTRSATWVSTEAVMGEVNP